MSNGTAHRRQYILDRDVHRIRPHWKSVRLSRHACLSYCGHLPVHEHRTMDGKPCWLVGLAYQVDRRLPPVAEQIMSAPEGRLAELTSTWAGRWILLTSQWLIADASGLLGVFYRPDRAGGVVASSSLALLKGLDPTLASTDRRLGWYGMNWYPPPATKLTGVRKLLPDQMIGLDAGEVCQLERSMLGRFAALSTDAVAVILLEALAHVLRGISTGCRSLHLGLTAGIDSRTVLAAALHAEIKLSAVTFDLPRSSSADLQLSAEICRSVGVPHRILRPNHRISGARKIFNEHTLGNCEDAPRFIYERGILDWLKQDDCIILGGCFELGRAFYKARFSGLDWAHVMRDPLLLARRFRDFGSVRDEARQLASWMQWRDHHPGAGGWQEMFYRDQRQCGWLSAVHQSLDLLNGDFMQAANSNYIHDLLLSRHPEDKRQVAVQRRIVAMLEMGERRYPINPDTDGRARRLRRRISVGCTKIWSETGNLARQVGSS